MHPSSSPCGAQEEAVALFDDVVCLSHLRWNFVFQRPNHLMSRCARERRVFFVEPPVTESRTTSPRLRVERIANGVHVVVPHLPEDLSPQHAERLQEELLRALLDRAAVRAPLVWLYTPMAVRLARRIPAAGYVYDCMDELSNFDGASRELREYEAETFRIADVVFTGGPSLYEANRGRHPRLFAFPNSVDIDHFARARESLAEAPEQAYLPRPRVGFFGVIDERLDLGLVEALADLRTDLQLLFVGPMGKIDRKALPARPNIHWLGPKRYDELPRYIAGWDVGMMPFARSDAPRFVSPTKTLAYLAAGRPVVSTSIRDVVEPYGRENLVRVADGAAAFAASIDAALRERGTAEGAARGRACDHALAQTSWDRTWAQMSTHVHEALVRRRRTADAEDEVPRSTVG
jgi:glycosyltransferase involved in cell wall biosynthesis